jgi:hypothetical protein
MSRKTILTVFILSFSVCIFTANGQRTKHYNLVKLLQENKLVTNPNQHTQVLDSSRKQAISTTGVVWLKDVNLKDGVIDVDLRGKDVFLKSFLGIAFHAKDTTNYDVIYFRPFRFRSTDTPTRKWSVQYMGVPGYDYDKLRKEHPGVYENEVNPVPLATDWFHATIVLKGEWITVYVNHSKTESLKVKGLNDNTSGSIGLWTSSELSEDFANLSIKESSE